MIPAQTLLRHAVAKNGGQQLVHLIKEGISDAERQQLGYNHVHSSRALDACACSSGTRPGLSHPIRAAAAAAANGGDDGDDAHGFCPVAVGMSSTAAALVPALVRGAVEAFDAIVHQDDVSIIHKVAAFRARQTALAPASVETDGAAAAATAGASSSNSSSRLQSLLTGLRTGLPNSTGLSGVAARTNTHTVRCYLTRQAKKGSAKQPDEDEEGYNSESDSRAERAEEANGAECVAQGASEGDQADSGQGRTNGFAEECRLQRQPGGCRLSAAGTQHHCFKCMGEHSATCLKVFFSHTSCSGYACLVL